MEKIELTLQDLVQAANIMDAAIRKGAFNASEAATVGTLYNKIVSYLKQFEQPKEESQDSATDQSKE